APRQVQARRSPLEIPRHPDRPRRLLQAARETHRRGHDRQSEEQTMILSIRKYGDDVLRHPAEPIAEIDAPLQKLIDDMVETMYAAPGVGLAANQVGVSRQLMVIDL